MYLLVKVEIKKFFLFNDCDFIEYMVVYFDKIFFLIFVLKMVWIYGKKIFKLLKILTIMFNIYGCGF